MRGKWTEIPSEDVLKLLDAQSVVDRLFLALLVEHVDGRVQLDPLPHQLQPHIVADF